MTDLSVVARDFAAFARSNFGAEVVEKENAVEMKIVAFGMDIGRQFGAGLAKSEEFMTRFTTTLGTRVYMPAATRNNPLRFISVLVHEIQHVLQFKESAVEFSWLYLNEPEARVRYEADAYAAGIAIDQWLTGRLPTDAIESIVAGLVGAYHVRPEDADLATDILRSHMASLKSGIVMTRAARESIKFLDSKYPQLKGTF